MSTVNLLAVAVDESQDHGDQTEDMTDDRAAYWNERYRDRGYLWGTDANRFLAVAAAGLPPGTALDLGCGQGRNAVWLAQRGHRVTGIDLSSVAIEHARRLAAEAGVDVEFRVADLTAWHPGSERWNLVVLSYLQVDADARRAIHGAASDAISPGGTLIVIAHHLDNLTEGVGGPQSPAVLFTEDDLLADFATLQVDRCERVLRPVETVEISGDAVDVLLIARRPAAVER